jgi:hypothetical protein
VAATCPGGRGVERGGGGEGGEGVGGYLTHSPYV